MHIILVIVFLIGTLKCEAANILYVTPFTSASHDMLLRPIGLELARRGHNVTVITAYREENPPPNYHHVMADNKKIWDVLGIERPNVFEMVNLTTIKFHELVLWGGAVANAEVALNSSEVQHFLKADNKFDVVIAEQFFQEAFYVLAHKYNAPLVLVTTFGNCMRHNILTRNPLQLATVIQEFTTIRDPNSFWGRFQNWYFSMYEYIHFIYSYMDKQEALVKKYVPNLPEPVPSLIEIQRNTALMLINNHFSYEPAAAYLPNIVEVGGVHLAKAVNILPKDLQEIMDKAVHGVVYINFGSNIRSSELPKEKFEAFVNVIRELKQTVLWKWEEKEISNKPKNLLIRDWMPQKEILSHPNVNLFIAHGGLIGTIEAIYYGVPIIGIPIYADQYNNLLLAQEQGFGRVLEFHDITEERIRKYVREALVNDSYRLKAKEVSRRFKDRPLDPMDTAMFWIEYVIRNKGAEFIKNKARNMSWVAYHMLDVYAFVLSIVLVSLLIFIKIVMLGFSLCKTKPISKEKKYKKK